MIDLSFLYQLAEGLPGLKDLPPDGQMIVFLGVIVQAIMGAFRLAITGTKTKENKPTHWYNRFLERFGPLLNVAWGGAIAAVSSVTVPVGLIGGAFSSYTFALVNKTVKPAIENVANRAKPQ